MHLFSSCTAIHPKESSNARERKHNTRMKVCLLQISCCKLIPQFSFSEDLVNAINHLGDQWKHKIQLRKFLYLFCWRLGKQSRGSILHVFSSYIITLCSTTMIYRQESSLETPMICPALHVLKFIICCHLISLQSSESQNSKQDLLF